MWLIAPWLVGFLIFKLIPIAASLALSLTDFMLLEPENTEFVGLKKYYALFNDPNTGIVFITTVKLVLLLVPLLTGTAILVATVLSNKKLMMKSETVVEKILFFIVQTP